MKRSMFDKKFLGQKLYCIAWEGNNDLLFSEDINEIAKHFDYGGTEGFLEDVSSYWCYDSKSKTFNADIDGPTFTSGATEEEICERLRKGGVCC